MFRNCDLLSQGQSPARGNYGICPTPAKSSRCQAGTDKYNAAGRVQTTTNAIMPRPDLSYNVSLSRTHSDPLDNMCSFGIKLRGVTIVRFLLAVFQSITFVILQQTMLATVMAVAEAAVADDALGTLFAVLVCAADLLGWHAAAEAAGDVDRRLALDVVV